MPCSDFFPGVALRFCCAFPWRHTRALPQGSSLLRQKSKWQAEVETWLSTLTGVCFPGAVSGCSALLIQKESGSLLHQGGLKHILAPRCVTGTAVSCGHQEDHTCPSTAVVSGASGGGVSGPHPGRGLSQNTHSQQSCGVLKLCPSSMEIHTFL